MPWSRTKEFSHPFLSPHLRGALRPIYNYSTYVIVEQAMFVPIRRLHNEFRENTLQLPPLPANMGTMALMHERQVPLMYCWSPSVLPKPSDWPEYINGEISDQIIVQHT